MGTDVAGALVGTGLPWGLVAGLVLLVLGLALLAAEVWVVPGFGVPAVLGLCALVGGAVLLAAGAGVLEAAALSRAAGTAVAALLAAAMGGALFWRFQPDRRRRLARAVPGLVLTANVGGGTRAGLQGAQGVALSDLRSAGVARIGGARVDVVTRGEYVAAGEPVEVVADEGYRRVVRARRVARRVRPGTEEAGPEGAGESWKAC
jgi:membrane-bound serine protease (ClpP class)